VPSFNIRVYGILCNQNGEVLISDEIINKQFYCKFPGGGLEYGEGLKDCLQREFKEETGLDVSIGDLIYITDFFQASAFHTDQQIISIYYRVHCTDTTALRTSQTPFEFSAEQLSSRNDCEVFRWIAMVKLSPDDLSLPIDKLVAGLIKQER
jgi:8-oxo-dGTP diphosphatase